MVINSGLLCLVSGSNHYQFYGGAWRLLLTWRDEIKLNTSISVFSAVVIFIFSHVIRQRVVHNFGYSSKLYVCTVTLTKEMIRPTPDHHGKWRL